MFRVKSSLLEFYSRHHKLVECYGISDLQMPTEMFQLSLHQSHPFFVESDIIEYACTFIITGATRRV